MTPSEIQETLRLSCALLRQFANLHVAESLEKAFAQLTEEVERQKSINEWSGRETEERSGG